MKRFLFLASVVICFFMFACLNVAPHKQTNMVEAATNCALASGSSQSTIQAALTAAGGGTCTGTVNANTVLLAAGTYAVSSTVTIPCNANFTGPTVPFTQAPNQTATINGSTGANWGFQSTSGCSNNQTIQYLAWNGGQPSNGGGFLYINPGSQNMTIQYNWLHGVNSPNGASASQAYLIAMGGSGTNTTSNITIQWNIFGNTSFSDCNGPMTGDQGDSENQQGGLCGAVLYSNQVQNIYVLNNVMHWLEEPLKGIETNNAPGWNCNNVVVDYNNITNYSRIGYEVQCYQPATATLTYTQYNNWGTRYNNDQNYDISLANGCNNGQYASGPGMCENHTDYNFALQVANTAADVGFEIWGQGTNGCTTHCTTANGNLFQGYLFNAITWSQSGNFQFNNNIFNIVSNGNNTNCAAPGGGYFNEETGNHPAFTPTCTGSSFSNNMTGTYASAVPTLTAGTTFGASMVVTITNPGTGRDANTTDWCTTDGTTPVAGGSAASTGNTALPYWAGANSATAGTITISTTTTVKCIGMWGAPNQPYSYQSGYGYVPTSVVSATYTGGGNITATPVLTPTTEVFYPGPLSVTASDTTSGAQIYCTNTAGITGTTPTTSSPLYSGAFSLSVTSTIECMATAAGATNSAVISQTYTLGSAPITATPVFSPASESFNPGPLSVSVSDSTGSSTIYCTNTSGTSGTVPTTSSPVYTGAFSLSASAVLECIATASGYQQSAVAIGQYPLSTTSTKNVTGGYQGNTGSINTLAVGAAGIQQTDYVTYTDSTTGTVPDLFGNTALWSSSNTAILTVSSTGLVSCVAVGTAQSLISIEPQNLDINHWTWTCTAGAGTVATPTFSPVAGTYTTTQLVTISDATAGSTIYYTTNGSTPTTSSTVYSTPITVNISQTINAIATAPTYISSAVGSAAYIIPATLTSCTLSAAGSVTSLVIGGAGVQMSGICGYSSTSSVITGTTTQDNVSSSTANSYTADYFIVGANPISPQSATIYIGTGTSGSKIDIGIIQATSPTAQATSTLCHATITETGLTNQLITVPITGCGTLPAGYTGFIWMNTNDPALTVGKQDCGGSCTGAATSTTYGDCTSVIGYGTYTGLGTAFTSACPGQYQRLQYITSTSILAAGGTLACSAPADANGGQITTWGTSASSIMAMGSFGGISPGIVTGVASGSANATAIATQGTTSVTCAPYAFTIGAPTLVNTTFAANTQTVAVGATAQFACSALYSNGVVTNCITTDQYGNEATWVSSATGVGTVTSPGGVFTAVSVGSTNVTPTIAGSPSLAIPMTVIAITPTAPTTVKGLTVKGLAIN